jgi:aminoglycoside/choline kinase family phosphotransferase
VCANAKIAQIRSEGNFSERRLDRLAQLRQWLEGVLGSSSFDIAPASGDASFRRYFRVTLPSGATRIAMDAPPEKEDCRPFVHAAGLLKAAGVHVPEVHAQDLAAGFLLLSDLGNTTFLQALDSGNADRLYGDALRALVRIQVASVPAALPPYGKDLLLAELRLFPDWYVARQLQRELSPAQRAVLDDAFALLLENNLAQPRVFVHRDYHSRNLMVCEPCPGILDFQDAVYGPISYDLVSLLRDAYIEWDEERVLDWAIVYWEAARKARLPVAGDFAAFYRDFEWMGAQRQLKVLGIFARLCYRDGKEAYLKDQPLVMRYLRRACERYAELAPLARLLGELANEQRQPRYSF